MSKVIYKYTLKGIYTEISTIDGKIIDFQEQAGQWCIWVLGDKMSQQLRKLKVYGTGWEGIGPNEAYVRTIHLSSGLVFHLFEEL